MNSFVCFLEEFAAWRFPFEIIWPLQNVKNTLFLGFFHFFVVWMVWAIFQPHKSKMMVSGQGWKVYQTPVRPYYLWYVCNLYNLYVPAKFHPDTLDYLNYLLFFPKWSASQNLTDKLHRTQARPRPPLASWLALPQWGFENCCIFQTKVAIIKCFYQIFKFKIIE